MRGLQCFLWPKKWVNQIHSWQLQSHFNIYSFLLQRRWITELKIWHIWCTNSSQCTHVWIKHILAFSWFYLFIKVIKVWCKKSAIIFVSQLLCFLMNCDTTMQRCMKSKRRVRCTWLNKSELGKSWLHIVHIVQKVQLCTLCNYAVHMCPANEWQFAFAASIFTAHTFTQVFFCCADFSALHVCPEILQNCSDFS